MVCGFIGLPSVRGGYMSEGLRYNRVETRVFCTVGKLLAYRRLSIGRWGGFDMHLGRWIWEGGSEGRRSAELVAG